MRVVSTISQMWIRRCSPALGGCLTRFLHASGNVSIGRGFRADRVPRCMVDKTARISIGDRVQFRDGVELRAHGTAQLIIEDGVRIDRYVRILAANEACLRIGRNSRIGLGTVMNGGDSLTIGSDCLVSGYVYLQTSMHRFGQKGVALRDQGFEHAPVSIGQNAWLGAHVVVMPGVAVGDGAVVGSNAVVTSNVEPGAVVAGVPARPIGEHGGREDTDDRG